MAFDSAQLKGVQTQNGEQEPPKDLRLAWTNSSHPTPSKGKKGPVTSRLGEKSHIGLWVKGVGPGVAGTENFKPKVSWPSYGGIGEGLMLDLSITCTRGNKGRQEKPLPSQDHGGDALAGVEQGVENSRPTAMTEGDTKERQVVRFQWP